MAQSGERNRRSPAPIVIAPEIYPAAPRSDYDPERRPSASETISMTSSMTSHQNTAGWVAVVLAAGRGTRMRSRLPKVLHPVAGRSMVRHVCEAVLAAGCEHIVVVTADAHDEVAEAVRASIPGVVIAEQGEPLGTGHAALAARIATGEASRVLILNGDLPLLTERTVRELMQRHDGSNSMLTFLTA